MGSDEPAEMTMSDGGPTPANGVAGLISAAGVEPLSSSPHVSTGTLPTVERLAAAVTRALEVVRHDRRGALSTVYPALADADPDHVGLAVTGVGGRIISDGDDRVRFTLMSIAKPFVLALVGDAVGPELVRATVGVNATGQAFNAAEPLERMPGGRTNPMVNAGAIATTSMTPGDDLESRWAFLLHGLSQLAGRDLDIDADTLASARATNHRNRGLAHLLYSKGVITTDPDEAVELYTRQSCVALDVRDVSTMGATIANGGRNPITGAPVASAAMCHDVLAVMATAGLYETSGDWLWDVGMPGKSGISGGIVTVSPGKGALATYSPLLDSAGNSVRGQVASALLSHELGLDMFAAPPA